ncbi:ligand-dependent nuclear receptor-interacting factor 1 isoform X2 [Hoplias malabaricus]|uniref:ligand-dependent nuclear receptor-interacting factor 1 isoform X2 n=1 Tax=Hoplias malabaricus TaxID=27720 RepID=UPI0034621E23
MENGTGVYYQAMPAVGPDGKNIMKLIPVQKVNGKFVQTHALTPRNDYQSRVYSQPAQIPPLYLQQNKFPTLQPTAGGRFILKTAPESSISVNSVKSQPQGSNVLLENSSNQICAPVLTPVQTQSSLQLPIQNNSKTVTLVNAPQQHVKTTKSLLVQSGHYLQIPPNATVKTVPASALPQSIKSQIYTSSNAPSNPANSSTVVYVSPVNSLKLGPSQQLTGLSKANELPQNLSHSQSINAVKNVNASSASSPKADQGVTTPIKWVVQEGTGNTAPCLIPVNSPSMTTDILKAVKQFETVRQTNQVSTEATSIPATQGKINPGKDNAIVMCNGKVYFVAKKNSEITKDVISGVGSKVHQPSTAGAETCTSNTVVKQNPKNAPASKKQNEIIDLCDDDEESTTCVATSPLTVLGGTAVESDEDSNVIFVSYIPPKSETETSKKVAETAAPKSCGRDTGSLECHEGNMEESCERTNTNNPVISSNVSGRNDNIAVCESENRGTVSQLSEEVHIQGTEVTERSVEKPSLEKSDSELRTMFGITSDLRVCLQRLNDTKEMDTQAEKRSINKRTLEGIRKLIQGSHIELKIKQLIQAQVRDPIEDNGLKDKKRKRLEQEVQKTCLETHSKATVNCEDEMQSASMAACIDSHLRCCPELEEETPHNSTSAKVAKQSIEPPCSSSLSQTSPIQTQTTKSPPMCASVSRKTPARQSKGTGRLCTACPCGTKVGAIASHSSSKHQNNTSSAETVCPKSADDIKETNRDCNTVISNTILENSVSSLNTSKYISEKSGNKCLVHVSQSHLEPGSSEKDICLVREQDGVCQSDSSSEEKTCSPCSRDNKQGNTCEEVVVGHVDVTINESDEPKEEEGKASSVGEIFGVSENLLSDLCSSVMLDPEEIKRRERIRRLKDLLKEKEAALEKLRQSM